MCVCVFIPFLLNSELQLTPSLLPPRDELNQKHCLYFFKHDVPAGHASIIFPQANVDSSL